MKVDHDLLRVAAFAAEHPQHLRKMRVSKRDFVHAFSESRRLGIHCTSTDFLPRGKLAKFAEDDDAQPVDFDRQRLISKLQDLGFDCGCIDDKTPVEVLASIIKSLTDDADDGDQTDDMDEDADDIMASQPEDDTRGVRSPAAERKKVARWAEKNRSALAAAGKSPAKFSEDFRRIQAKRPGFTARDYGIGG